MEMTITRALTELKKIDHKTQQAIALGFVTSVLIGEGDKQKVQSSAYTVEQLKQKKQSSNDTIESLLKRKVDLKVAVNESNAKTTVVVLGESMTVTKAIELKAQRPMLIHLLDTLKRSLQMHKQEVTKLNNRLDDEVLTLTSKSLETPADKEMNDAIITNLQKSKRASLFEEVNLTERILSMEATIAELDENLDFTLSESNSVTMITIAD